jgi:hypothetical protein
VIQSSRTRSLLVDALRATWLPWLVARAVLGLALAASRYHNARGHPLNVRGLAQSANGLMAFDAGWYRGIAQLGYGSASSGSLRFFPLFPLTVRALHLVLPLSWSTCTALVANLAAFLAAMALYLLVAADLDDARLATRSVWLLCLGPASFVLVLGYAEGLFLALEILAFVALRRQAFWWAALFGLAAALTRPVGVLFVVPVLVEVLVAWRSRSKRPSLSSVVALLAPLAGFLGFCSWCRAALGDFWAPVRIQEQSSHHGGLSDPLVVISHAFTGALHGHHLGTALHIPWIALSVVLVVLAYQRLPLSYAAFATALVLVALSGSNLDSFERYLLSAFPLTIAGASLLRSKKVAGWVLGLSTLVMGGYAFLIFQGVSVP